MFIERFVRAAHHSEQSLEALIISRKRSILASLISELASCSGSIDFSITSQIDMETVPTSPSRLALRIVLHAKNGAKESAGVPGQPALRGNGSPADRTLSVAPAASVPPRHAASRGPKSRAIRTSGYRGSLGSDPKGDSTSDSLFRDGDFWISARTIDEGCHVQGVEG